MDLKKDNLVSKWFKLNSFLNQKSEKIQKMYNFSMYVEYASGAWRPGGPASKQPAVVTYDNEACLCDEISNHTDITPH
jgi:hypothetical protein